LRLMCKENLGDGACKYWRGGFPSTSKSVD
jgi:hypothetical protein